MKKSKNIILDSLFFDFNEYINQNPIENFKFNSLHFPVMIREVLFFYSLIQKKVPIVLDCTIGGGGHSIFLFQRKECQLFGIERDFRMIEILKNNLQNYQIPYLILNNSMDDNINKNLINKNCKFYILHKRFSFAKEFIDQIDQKVDFLLCDLGISMYHLKNNWGFSFKDSKLDFRLDQKSLDVHQILNEFSEEELSHILYQFGEERFSKHIAKEIIKNRPIFSSQQLRNCILKVYYKITKKKFIPEKVVQRTFQALRIYGNSELEELETLLGNLDNVLNSNGIAVFISFHSLEDRKIKNYTKQYKEKFRILKKPLLPKKDEIILNQASHSAKMRVLWKI